MTDTDPRKIHVHFLKGKFYVWDHNDVLELRTKYRIIGSLIGSLPSQPHQNNFHSLPLLLLREEVFLLSQQNAIKIIDEEKSYQNQVIDGKISRKRKMLDEEEENQKEKGKEKEKEKEINTLEDKTQKEQQENAFRIKTSAASCSNYLPIEISLESITSQDSTNSQQNKLKQDLKQRVFCDLWQKGYFLTSGSKFGGDYLAYPGDPSSFHSHFVVIILLSSERLSALELISLGRLGTTVKKNCLICSVDSSDALTYFSLEWTGMN